MIDDDWILSEIDMHSQTVEKEGGVNGKRSAWEHRARLAFSPHSRVIDLDMLCSSDSHQSMSLRYLNRKIQHLIVSFVHLLSDTL